MTMDELADRLNVFQLEDVVWHWHMDEYDYSFTTDIELYTGYPVKDNTTNKVVFVVGKDGVTDLTKEDIKVARQYGLKV